MQLKLPSAHCDSTLMMYALCLLTVTIAKGGCAMAVTVTSIKPWKLETENRPGALADALAPLAEAGINLEYVEAYAHEAAPERASIYIYPITGRKAIATARAAGFERVTESTLV
ncbi:MAG TPA: ACT domain-containing protein [Armatimonadetes bacterium]|nr:ACT domain-containing protein [Armatimonadota bacterium]